jgi:hypothetical protein
MLSPTVLALPDSNQQVNTERPESADAILADPIGRVDVLQQSGPLAGHEHLLSWFAAGATLRMVVATDPATLPGKATW